jgi:uncharacterized protein (TIGR04255 family)
VMTRVKISALRVPADISGASVRGEMSERVRFAAPPVVEVVCSVAYATATPLKSVDVGLYGQRIAARFPDVDDAPPLPNIPTDATGPRLQLAGVMQWASFLPPLRRTWFLNSDEQSLIQIQDNRFIYNWRRQTADVSYPTYDKVIERFESELSEFREFLASAGKGELQFQQFELVYVNRIDETNGLGTAGVSGVLVDHIRDASRQRFLPTPDSVLWQTAYPLPDGAGTLHVIAQSLIDAPDQAAYLRLDIAARGSPADRSEDGRKNWFNLAHQWITFGFADLTAPSLQTEFWGRIS